jgi:hypothetical protein
MATPSSLDQDRITPSVFTGGGRTDTIRENAMTDRMPAEAGSCSAREKCTNQATTCALVLGALLAAACGAKQRREAREVGAPAASSVVPSAELAAITGPQAASSAPTPTPVVRAYPEEAIARARAHNGNKSCMGLVYKKGCAELRTGTVTLSVLLDPAGHVIGVDVLKNTIVKDPELVAQCLKKHVPDWTFDPPRDASPSFELEISLSDKC